MNKTVIAIIAAIVVIGGGYYVYDSGQKAEQAKIEAELQEIDSMACQGGVLALTDEANFHGDEDFPQAIALIEGFHGKTMWAFLEHHGYWAGATLFLHSDNISDSFWKKRNDLPHLPPNVEEEYTEQLAQAISHFFHTKQFVLQYSSFS